MKTRHLVVVMLFAAASCAAQTTTLYDNFNQRFLNQSLWFSVCAGFSVTENCATDVVAGNLHLARGMTGNNDSNVGTNGGSATAFFFNPVPIRSITTDVLVLDVDEVPCAANPSSGATNADIIARFFNAGDGTENDDVGAMIIFGRGPANPKGQLYVFGSYFHNGDYTHTVFLGNTQIGVPMRATVAWDQPNHRFLFNLTNKLTHVATRGVLTYGFSDTTPPADPEKHLDAGVLPTNCVATQTWMSTDVLFDNVYIVQ